MRTPSPADFERMGAGADEMHAARSAHQRPLTRIPTGTGNDMSLLGRLPDVDDHVGEQHGSLTRCAVDGEMWPCSAIEQAKRLSAVSVALMEMVDVGWYLAAYYPPQLDPPKHRVRGIVVGYRDVEDHGRIYTLVGTKFGKPALRDMAARDVDPNLDGAMPQGHRTIDAYRRLAEHVGRGTGTADGTDVKYLAAALALAQAST